MKLSGSQLRIRSRSRNNVRGNGAFLGVTVPLSSLSFLLFFSLFLRVRTVAGEYYYSRLNSSSDSQVNAKVGARI